MLKTSEKAIVEKAFAIAKRDLRKCYEKQGIFAGRKHFDDYWARDGFFAAMGSLCLKDYEIVKKQLSIFSKFQTPNGELPVRIGTYFILPKFLGIKLGKKDLKPRYRQDKLFSHVVDSNSLFVILAHEFLIQTKDSKFIKQLLPKLKKAMQWLQTQKNNGLIHEGKYGNWADSLKKTGNVLYSNVCYYRANVCLSIMLSKLGQPWKEFSNEAKQVKDILNSKFWFEPSNNQGFYIDWYSKTPNKYFSSDGNILAGLWGLSSRNQNDKIQNYMDAHGLNHGKTIKTNHPKYKQHHVPGVLNLFNMHDYHNGLLWLWLGAFDILFKHKNGFKEKAKEELVKLSKIICEHKEVYEVYEPNGQPVQRLFYRSEHPFAWSSGLFVYMCSNLSKDLKLNIQKEAN